MKKNWSVVLFSALAFVCGFASDSMGGTPFCHITGFVKNFNDGSLTVVVEWGGFTIDGMDGRDQTILGSWWGASFAQSNSGQVNVVIPRGQWFPGDWCMVQGYLGGNAVQGCTDGAPIPSTFGPQKSQLQRWLTSAAIPERILR
jgi:hypothetical protein